MDIEELLTPSSPPVPPPPAARWPRRIALLSAHTSPLAPLGGRDTGGMNVYVRQLARELAGRGIAVDVYTRASHPDTPPIEEDTPGFRTINLSAGPRTPVSRERLHALLPDFVAAVDAFRRSDRIEYDVLHSHYWLSGLAAAPLARGWRAPWAHMSHTLGVLKDAYRGPFQEPESALRLRSEAAVLREADGVIASNETERDDILARCGLDPSRLYVAPCGVDLSLFHPGDRTEARAALGLGRDEKVALYVGRIEPLKGLDTFIEAADLLRRRVPRLRVLLVGGVTRTRVPGPGDAATEAELRRLRAHVARLGLEDVVEFRGPRPQAELPTWYRAADVMVVTSHYESFGMAALEALACGTPVVASHVGGLASTIRDGQNGYLALPGDAPAFASGIERVLCRPELRDELSAEAHRTAQRYSWQRVADHNLGVYHNLLATAVLAPPPLLDHDIAM